jgi:hypothetical protein
MVENPTTNFGLGRPAGGFRPWGSNWLDTMDILEKALGSNLVKAVGGGVDVTLTALEAVYASFEFTGVLTANINVIVPAKHGPYRCLNSTTGAFSLKVKTSAGTGIFLPQGETREFYCDGTNVIAMDSFFLRPIADPPGVLSNNSGSPADDVDIAGGTWKAQDAEANITIPATTLSMLTAGNGGRLDGESRTNGAWYHVMSGRDTTTGLDVAGFKKTLVKPTGWDYFRRHGSIKLDTIGEVTAFHQEADDFFWAARVVAVNTGAANTTRNTFTAQVPEGLPVLAKMSWRIGNSAVSFLVVDHAEATDVAASATNFDLAILANGQGNVNLERWTNASQQIHYRQSVESPTTLDGLIIGWTDPRGRGG